MFSLCCRPMQIVLQCTDKDSCPAVSHIIVRLLLLGNFAARIWSTSMMSLQVAVAKIAKHAGVESGDTLEMIERPGGGFSFVLVDAQGSGRGAKTLSNMVATRAITLLKDGTRDGAAARAVHDYLYTYR